MHQIISARRAASRANTSGRVFPRTMTRMGSMSIKANNPTENELHDWAYAPDAEEPVQDWGLRLSWQMDRGLLRRCVEFACDSDCPQADFFLDVLYLWVERIARREDFGVTR